MQISRINNSKTSLSTIGTTVKASACRIYNQGSIPSKFKVFPACAHFLMCLKLEIGQVKSKFMNLHS